MSGATDTMQSGAGALASPGMVRIPQGSFLLRSDVHYAEKMP